MSSHDCQIRGTLSLKGGVTQFEITAASAPLLDWVGLAFERVWRDGSISFCEASSELEVLVDCHCSPGGGYRIDELESTIDALNALVREPGYLEFQDFDTGSTDEMITPYFVGATPEDRDRARVEYGILAASQWLAPLLGTETMQALGQHIRSLPINVQAGARRRGDAS